jgi:hypothetical protein
MFGDLLHTYQTNDLDLWVLYKFVAHVFDGFYNGGSHKQCFSIGVLKI